jgi:hypothetical protein
MRKKNIWNGKVGLLLAASIVLASGAVHAEPLPQIVLGNVTYAGTGCPQGTARAILSPNGRLISILFDRFAGVGDTAPTASCNVDVPIQLSPGTGLRIRNIEVRGFASMPAGRRGSVRGTFRIRGCPPVTFSRTFSGPFSQEFAIQQSGAACPALCGGSTFLHGLIHAAVQGSPAAPGAGMVTVDSVAVQLEEVRC